MSSAVSRVVIACFDESGKLNDSIVSFGGIVAPEGALNAIGVRWKRRLELDGLPHTSMKDAMHFKDSYANWDEDVERRDTVLCDLATILADSGVLICESSQTTAEFKALPQQDRKKLGNDPQYGGFETCIAGILSADRQLGLHVVCDLAEEYSEKCVTLFHKLRLRNHIAKERCMGISFIDDEHHAGLQAADMIAYCSRAVHQCQLITPQPIVNDLKEILFAHPPTERWFVWDADGEGIGSGRIE
jgi:hypothetical protein